MLMSIAFASFAMAQTPPASTRQPATQTTPQTDETAPRAASSPHQREATKTDATEAATPSATDPSSSSTPHQKQAMAKANEQKMRDCVKRSRAADTSMTEDQAKKSCMEQMKTTTNK
jgi:hypothetical protein